MEHGITQSVPLVGDPGADGARGKGNLVPPSPADLMARRRLLIATSVVGGAGLIATALPFIDSMTPSARARAEGGPTDVDVSTMRLGELRTAVWRGNPIWLLRRDPAMLASLQRDTRLLADPDSTRSSQPAGCQNIYRSLQPGLAVIVGVCTHLGCSPVMHGISEAGTANLGSDWPGGFFCPCHGSKFDLSGRVFKNVPAPANLVIPPYNFVTPSHVRIGT